jgi:hypothetical protein
MRVVTREFFVGLTNDFVTRLEAEVLTPAQHALDTYQASLNDELARTPPDDTNEETRAGIAQDLKLIDRAMRVVEFERERFADMGRLLT